MPSVWAERHHTQAYTSVHTRTHTHTHTQKAFVASGRLHHLRFLVGFPPAPAPRRAILWPAPPLNQAGVEMRSIGQTFRRRLLVVAGVGCSEFFCVCVCVFRHAECELFRRYGRFHLSVTTSTTTTATTRGGSVAVTRSCGLESFLGDGPMNRRLS